MFGFNLDLRQTSGSVHQCQLSSTRGSSSICGPQEGAVSRWVRRHEVLEVIKGEARLWPNAARLKEVSDEREGKVKRKPEPVFWTVGIEEIPGA